MAYNLLKGKRGIIFGALFLVKPFGPAGLAWGVVLGALLHILIQYPAVKFSGFYFHWAFSRYRIFELGLKSHANLL